VTFQLFPHSTPSVHQTYVTGSLSAVSFIGSTLVGLRLQCSRSAAGRQPETVVRVRPSFVETAGRAVQFAVDVACRSVGRRCDSRAPETIDQRRRLSVLPQRPIVHGQCWLLDHSMTIAHCCASKSNCQRPVHRVDSSTRPNLTNCIDAVVSCLTLLTTLR